MEYIPSVPSQPLPLVQDLARLIKAVELADIIILSYSQVHILEHLLISARSPVVLIDMRALTVHHSPSHIVSLLEQAPSDSSFIITAQQASLLSLSQLARAVVMPLINSRAQWDPHVDRGVFNDNRNHDSGPLLSTHHEVNLSVNDSVLNEGIELIKKLITNRH
jgi:hypothetical protein